MKTIEYIATRLGLYFFFLILSTPLILVCVAAMDYINRNPKYSNFGWPFAIIFLIWFFLLPWLTKNAAGYMVTNNMGMWAAMRLAIYDLRLILAFIPFFGQWFIPNKDEGEEKDEDEKA